VETQKSKIVSRAIVLFVMLLPWSHLAEAQQPKKIARIGFLSGRGNPTPTTPDPLGDAFRQGLQDLGYIVGKNVLI
jgi:hypothetical protein